jgi:uncharacterized protein YkwD
MPSLRALPVLLLLAAPTPLTAPSAIAAPLPAPSPRAPVSPADLTRAINALREAAGVPPLTPMVSLDHVAQARARELARRKEPVIDNPTALFAHVDRQMRDAGYQPHGWTESFSVTVGGVDQVIQYFQERDPEAFKDAMRADFQHLGIGVAELGGVPLYTFLVAWPEEQFYLRQIAPLADLAQVRQEMLARVNEARKSAGAPPLTLEPRLEQAAQAHAEDKLVRSFYAHQTPEGKMPRDRAEGVGYHGRLVAENIAAGSLSVETVLSGWLLSSGHRRNLLDPALRHLGVGLAVGPFEHRYRTLWVQLFGLSQEPHPPAAPAP